MYSAWALNRDHVARLAGFFSRLNRRRRVQQALRPPPSFRAHPAGDAREDRLVDLSANGGRHVVQRGVRRQLQRGLDDALQREVDQVRRVVPRLRRLADRGLRQRPGPLRVPGRALPRAHQAAVQPHRPIRPVVRLGFRGQAEAVPHVVGDGIGDLLPRAENRAIRWKHFRSTSSASSDSGVSVRSLAHAASSSVGVKNKCSTHAEVSRLNCG
jgi:hypothetical protein